jgi:hypothetical protein
MPRSDSTPTAAARVAAETFPLSAALLSTETVEFLFSVEAVTRDSNSLGLPA